MIAEESQDFSIKAYLDDHLNMEPETDSFAEGSTLVGGFDTASYLESTTRFDSPPQQDDTISSVITANEPHPPTCVIEPSEFLVKNDSFAESLLRAHPLFLSFLKNYNHPFFVWEDHSFQEDATIQTETDVLTNTLEQNLERICSLSEGPALIFIHVRLIPHLDRIRGLSEKRRNPDTTFITYGTHSTLASQSLSLAIIYPAGGVVTLTAACLLANPLRVLQKLHEIAIHPLWCAYVLPSVLGFAIRRFHFKNDPLQEYGRGNFPYEPFLEAIENGELALIRAPRPDTEPAAWVQAQVESLLRDRQEILEFCLESDIESNPLEDILQDLSVLHVQPSIISSYRRFIVLVDEAELSCSDEFKRRGVRVLLDIL
ncbi:hypothetical protein VKT23_005788 [Stygiomarasmius scandens]|uniref:Uncharacterized protein n=1 Tax=Marasmiellus scandens TaxID=2682957 RepID=A0ABR1JTW9_9AGAR